MPSTNNLLNAYYEPGTVLDTGNMEMGKIYKGLVFIELDSNARSLTIN